LAGIFCIDEGIEVRAIEDQAAHLQVEALEQALGEASLMAAMGFSPSNSMFVPETLRGKLLRSSAQPTRQRSGAEPSGHL